jgi:hypothetical protein
MKTTFEMNQKGSALLIVIIITLLLTVIATSLYSSGRSHRKQVQAQFNYAVTSDRSDTAVQSAIIWLNTFDDPPELDADYVTGCTNCFNEFTDKKESDVSSIDSSDFHKIDENGDGKIDASDHAAFLIIPLGGSTSNNCVQNDGYSNACLRTHSYLIVARALGGVSTLVERKQEFKRSFYY